LGSPSGFQWSTPVVIDTSTLNLAAKRFSVMAVDSAGTISVAWTDQLQGGGDYIIFERSTNGGNTWIRAIPFNSSYQYIVRDLAFDHNGIIWLLYSHSAGEFNPYYLKLSKSTDNGGTSTNVFSSIEYVAPYFSSKLAIDRSNSI
jgi:hypothetical protein